MSVCAMRANRKRDQSFIVRLVFAVAGGYQAVEDTGRLNLTKAGKGHYEHSSAMRKRLPLAGFFPS